MPSIPMPRILLGLLFAALLPAQALGAASAEDAKSEAWMAEHYTKHEHRIPMRDGVRLFTRVYVPKDSSTAWPILLTRTPYALKPYGPDSYSKLSGSLGTFAEDRFILVTQDVRGRYASEGTFEHVRPFRPGKSGIQTDESSDAWDTIDWLVKHVPGNNGRVGMTGMSYPGFYTSMGMIDSHPALKAASPQAPIADWFMGDDLHHNGAFLLSQNVGFFYAFELPSDDPLHDGGRRPRFGTPDGYDFFLRLGSAMNTDTLLFKGASRAWTEFLSHPNYDDFWKARNIRPHLRDVRCAVMTVGGWYDAEDLFGALETYRATEAQNPGITNLLVMGPWAHGDWNRKEGSQVGDIRFRAKTAEYFRQNIELPFFRRHLKDDPQSPMTEAHIFETGTACWRRFDQWPPKGIASRPLHLREGGALRFEAPRGNAEAFDEYISDPAKPVPFTLEVTTDYPRGYPTHDQRFAASRPDVLVYETEPLEEDLTLAGPIPVSLHVSTTGTDADWVVKVIDVFDPDYPEPEPNPSYLVMGGYQQLVRGDVFRSRFRNSFEKPEPMEPGKVTRITFTLPDVCHTFRRGHRLMVQVQSTWFPLVDRNPQTYVDIYRARPEDYRKATQRIHRGETTPSMLTLPVLPR